MNFFKKSNKYLTINDLRSKFRITKDFVVISAEIATIDPSFKDSDDILTGLKKAFTNSRTAKFWKCRKLLQSPFYNFCTGLLPVAEKQIFQIIQK